MKPRLVIGKGSILVNRPNQKSGDKNNCKHQNDMGVQNDMTHTSSYHCASPLTAGLGPHFPNPFIVGSDLTSNSQMSNDESIKKKKDLNGIIPEQSDS